MRSALLALALFAGSAGVASADAKADNAAFLAKNATAEGVQTLPAIQYKVLKSGPADGPITRRSSTVHVRYEGRFLNGKVFNTSAEVSPADGIAVFPLQKLIPGWLTVLQLMKPGDEWEVYLPPVFGYGASGKDTVPPNSLLIFRIELVSSEPG